MILICTAKRALPFITPMLCVSCAVFSASETPTTGPVVGQTSTYLLTIMPEQICPTSQYGSSFVRAEVVHPSAKLCYYTDWADTKAGV